MSGDGAGEGRARWQDENHHSIALQFVELPTLVGPCRSFLSKHFRRIISSVVAP